MRRMYFYSPFRKSVIFRKSLKLFCIVFLLAFIFVWIAGMRDIINKYSLNQLEYLVTNIIDESVYECFEKYKFDYDSLMIIDKDKNGKINTISIEPYAANILKSEISKNIVERVNNISNDDLEITLGMLIGHFGLGSWGPKLPLTVSPNGNVSIDFTNSFVSSGINQVQDSVYIDVNVDVSAMMPFFRFNSKIHSSVIVSQTIIIGDVPNTYLEIGDKANDR